MLFTETMSRVRIYVHSEYVDNVLASLGQASILHQLDVRETLAREAQGLIETTESSDRLYRIGLTVSRLRSVMSSLGVPTSISHGELKSGFSLPDADLAKLEQTLTELEAEVSGLTSKLSGIGEGKAEEASAIRKKLVEIRKAKEAELASMLSLLEAARAVEEAKTRSGKTRWTYIIEGWVPKKAMGKLEEIVSGSSEGKCSILELEPRRPNGHGAAAEAPPTLMSNPGPARAYEKLVTAFGIPNYFEVDPTIFMFFTFPLIFGMMFGDVGQGALLLLAAMAFYLLKRRGAKALPGLGEDMSSYLLEGAPLLAMCSIGSIIFGFLYGVIFGSERLFLELDGVVHSYLGVSMHESIKEGSHSLEAFLSGILGFHVRIPFPFDPLHQPTEMARISLYAAFLHIPLGLILAIINNVRLGEVKEAIVGPGLWLWFYTSFAYLLARYWLKLPQALQSDPVNLLILVVPIIAMMGIRTAVHRGEGLMESLEHLIASLANTISYARIFAFAMIHGVFSRAPWPLLEQGGLVGILGFALLFPFVTIFAILLAETMLSIMQTLRLHWVEWFLKFYKGDGVRFQPFKVPGAWS